MLWLFAARHNRIPAEADVLGSPANWRDAC